MIKKEIERLTELRKNLQEKQVNATKDNSKADNEMEDVAEGIRTRFEEQNIKPLKVRIRVIEAELKEISNLVLAEGIQVQKQQGIANAHKTKIEQEDEKIKETLDKINDLQE
jgi:accessory colonization factor AcfC